MPDNIIKFGFSEACNLVVRIFVCFNSCGRGAFHAAIEVHGREWSYECRTAWLGPMSFCSATHGRESDPLTHWPWPSLLPLSLWSISLARDGSSVFRSREQGWDFRSSANAIIFFNMPFDPANPSDVVVSYRRWAEQVPID